MPERHQATFTGEEDPTVRINAELIDDTHEKYSQPLVPGEARTYEQGKEQQVSFRVTEEKLINGTDPVPFNVRTNEKGQWVVESPVLQGESWVLPADVEFTIDMNGVSIRTREDVVANVPPRQLTTGGFPSLITQLMATQARDSGVGHPRLTLLSHTTEGGENYLSMRNLGSDAMTTETVALRVTPEDEVTEETPDNTGEDTIIVSKDTIKAADVPEQVEDLGEPTQKVDMNTILNEGREARVESPVVESETSVAPLDDKGDVLPHGVESEGEPVVDAVESQEKVVKSVVKPLGKRSIHAALGGLDGDIDDVTTESPEVETQVEKPIERLILKDLTVPEAIGKTVEHAADRFAAMGKDLTEVTEGFDRAINEVFQTGSRIEEGKIFDVLDRLKSVLGRNNAEFEDMKTEIEKYLEAENDVHDASKKKEVLTEAEEKEETLRKQAFEAMEQLGEKLDTMNTANAGALEVHRKLDDALRSMTGKPYYPDDRQFTGLRDVVNAHITDLVTALQDRTSGGRDARKALEQLEETQQSLALVAQE